MKAEKVQGLSAAEVQASRDQYGENVLTPPARQSMWRLYLEKYEDPVIRILLVAAAVSLALAFVKGEYVETFGIIAAIFLATTIGFYFERDAARRFDVLTQMGEEQPVKVLREGRVQEVARREVVVGDVVIVETGDEVPADGTLFEATDLQVDESSLTGEPLTTKEAFAGDADRLAASPREEATPSGNGAYPRHLLLRSSMVMSGSGRFTVTAVGDATEIGQVAREATELTSVKTPLNLQLDRLARLISRVGSAVSIAAFLLFLVHDILTQSLWHTDDYVGMAETVLRYFMMAVTLIVMAVPEGLPMAVTLALALNMRRMLKSNNLVRKLSASETMGAVTVICTDKTGTLTENRMTVAGMHMKEGFTLDSMAQAIALNTTANLEEAPSVKGIGNPTEAALLLWLRDQGIDYREIRSSARILDRVPFSTERKYMATLVWYEDCPRLYVKGAPEMLLAYCSMDGEHRRVAQAILRDYQRQAMRTLALAMVPMEKGTTRVPPEPFPHLWPQAIVAISDPLRPEVPEAIRQCRQAGIDIKIVTGDSCDTALEIARQTGILTDDIDRDAHITGAEFAAMHDWDAMSMAKDLKVMSRARPSDKQRLVSLLQERGEVVAVTGDGTNDAPALNHAHVGLSLGSGTSVAKQASAITLIDDSFRSIVQAVMWGRSLYRNIQRFIFFQLIVNVTALLLVLCGAFVGTELPLTITQILWINLIMDTFAAMALASLPPSREVMREKPRSQHAFILSRPMIWGIAVIGLLFFAVTFSLLCYFEREDNVSTHELTIFFSVFVMLQWWNLFNARSLGSTHSAFHRLWACRGFLLVLLMVLAGQWLIVTYGGTMFRTLPLSWQWWAVIIAGTSPVLWIGEGYKWIRRTWKPSR